MLTLALAACGGGGDAVDVNPSSTIVTVENGAGSPLPGITVTLSSTVVGVRPAGVVATGITNALGFTTFTLPSTSPLCVSAAVSAAPLVFKSECRSAPFPSMVLLRP